MLNAVLPKGLTPAVLCGEAGSFGRADSGNSPRCRGRQGVFRGAAILTPGTDVSAGSLRFVFPVSWVA